MIDFGMMKLNLLFINVKNIIKKTNRDGYFRIPFLGREKT
jgi:hypothetical protein